jgi:hypothetical protein
VCETGDVSLSDKHDRADTYREKRYKRLSSVQQDVLPHRHDRHQASVSKAIARVVYRVRDSGIAQKLRPVRASRPIPKTAANCESERQTRSCRIDPYAFFLSFIFFAINCSGSLELHSAMLRYFGKKRVYVFPPLLII